MEAEIEVMHLQGKECRRLPALTRDQEGVLPCSSLSVFLAILGSQYFCMNYRICLSISTKTSCQTFHKDSVESVDSFGEISSVGKESTCNAGNPDLIPESGRSTGEGIGYPPQYSWVPLVAQLVKNLPAMQETWI